jgi:hypothetical protein
VPDSNALGPERTYVGVLLKAVLRAPFAALARRDLAAAAPLVLIPAAGIAAVAGFVRASLARSG